MNAGCSVLISHLLLKASQALYPGWDKLSQLEEHMEGIVLQQGEGGACWLGAVEAERGFWVMKVKLRGAGSAPSVAQVGWEPGVGARVQLGCR